MKKEIERLRELRIMLKKQIDSMELIKKTAEDRLKAFHKEWNELNLKIDGKPKPIVWP